MYRWSESKNKDVVFIEVLTDHSKWIFNAYLTIVKIIEVLNETCRVRF